MTTIKSNNCLYELYHAAYIRILSSGRKTLDPKGSSHLQSDYYKLPEKYPESASHRYT